MGPGDIVGNRFDVETLVGRGGMSTVWRAHDRKSGRPVALKIVASDRESFERFSLEARILADLHHPGFVRYVAHGTLSDGENWMALEWLEGETLEERLARARLGLGEAIQIVTTAAEALAAAHARGVIHRDIKPSNLFLVPEPPGVKVLDLGIARLANALARSSTRTGIVMGTPGYMAPEQARGEKAIDARADVFALGCVLFECLTGRPAFVGEHIMAVLAKVLLESAPPLSQVEPGIPPELDELVLRLLAKNRDERPADAAAVATELRALSVFGVEPRVARGTPAQGLTAREQQLVCVVVARTTAHVQDEREGRTLVGMAPGMALRALQPVVQRYGGFLEQLADGSVVVTASSNGTPTDQALQAARLALALRALLPDVPMAIATGHGLVGMRFPVGEAIDRAVTLLGAPLPAPVDEGRRLRAIRLDSVTAGLLDAGRFDLRGDEAGLLLRGEQDPTGGGRTVLGKPTPFVGRDRELASLESIWEDCLSEPVARAVLVEGPPGSGKSRLQYEFFRRALAREPQPELWLGRGDPMRAGSPFGMVAPAIKRTSGILEGEPLAVRQMKLRARVSRHLGAGDLARVVPFLGEMLDIPFDAAEFPQLVAARQDPSLLSDLVVRAFEDWLDAETADRPLLVILEDLHWGDFPSVKLLEAALRHLRDRPIFVLAVARPEVRRLFPDLFAERDLVEIRLGELTRRAAERIARSVLGDQVADAELRRMVEYAAGNVFYLEELIRARAEGYRTLPDSVLGMVEVRLSALPADERRILRAASVFGGVFWRSGVSALLGGFEPEALDDLFARLAERELILRKREHRFPGEPEYAFRHVLHREAAYAMLTGADRELGHRLAGAWLEERGDTDATQLADHFLRGGRPGRALEWCQRAAERALMGDDLVGTLAWVERGIRCGAGGEARAVLRFFQTEAHRWRGQHVEAEAAGLLALAELERGTPWWLEAAAATATAAGKLGHVEQLDVIADDLLDLGAAAEVPAQHVVASACVAGHLLNLGKIEHARRLLDQIDRHLPDADDPQAPPTAAAWVLRTRAFWAIHEGDVGRFLDLTSRSVEVFERAGDRKHACLQRANQGYGRLLLGAHDEAESALRASLETARAMGVNHIAATAKQNLGITLGRQGQFDEGRRLLAESIEEFREHRDPRMEGASRVYLAVILRDSGDLQAAEAQARQALALLEVIPSVRAEALGVLASILVAQGRVDEARPLAEEARRVAAELGGLEDGEAAVDLALAEALAAAGDKDGARKVLREARVRLLGRADKIGSQACRDSYLLRVPDHARALALWAEWNPEEG